MPQIAAADVTYTVIDGSAKADPGNPTTSRIVAITFGNGTLTYTSGGIPLTQAKLGCPTALQSLVMLDTGHASGYLPKWNQTANTVRLYNDANVTAAAAAAFSEVLTSAAVSAVTLRVLVEGY